MDESLTTEDQSHVSEERRGEERRTKRIDEGPQDEIENFDKFLDTQSFDTAITDEDTQQDDGNVPEVLRESDEQREALQEPEATSIEKKQPAGADGKISSRTRLKSEDAHSPLFPLLHSNTDCHFPLSSYVASYPFFTICAVAKPGLMNRVKDGIRTGRDAIVCFSSQLAKAMSEWKSTSKSLDGRSPLTRMKEQADQRAEQKRREAEEKRLEEKA